jgi:hypothetical protein
MRIYTNQNSGLTVATGKIKALSEDRTVLTIVAEEYKDGERKDVELNISNPIGFNPDDYKVGFTVTAAGYKHGKGVIQAERVLVGNDIFETADLTVVTGLVKFARYNEEKDKDGNPRLKQDGTPRKPHFDITISVKEDDKYVDHTIKVYEGRHEEGKKSQLERVQAMFSRFDRQTNRISVAVVTQPGVPRSYTVTKDLKEYTNFVCDHMGYKSIDVEYIDAREKTQAPAQKAAPTQTAPVAQAPAQEQNGFSAAEMDMGEQEFT